MYRSYFLNIKYKIFYVYVNTLLKTDVIDSLKE